MVLPALVLETLNFFQRGMPWRGESLWTIDWFAISLFILGPLVAGAAAVDAANLTRPGNLHLVLAVRGFYRPYLRAFAWCVGPVAAVHLVAIGAGLAVGGFPEATSWLWILVAIVVQILAFCWFAAIGSTVGRFASPLAAGAVAAVGSFALVYLLGEDGETAFELLSLGGATVSRLGLVYAPGYLIAQLLTFTVTGVALLFAPFRLRSGFRAPTLLGASMLALILTVIVVGQYALPEKRIEANPQPPTQCTGSQPEICVFSEHTRFESQIVDHVQKLSQVAKENGYPMLVPRRVEELSRTYRVQNQGVTGLDIQSHSYRTGIIDINDVAIEMVRPLHCKQLYTEEPPGEKYWERESELFATLLSLAGLKPSVEEYPWKVDILTPGEVDSILQDYATCNLEGE